MKKFLYRIALPALVLGVVYYYAYSSGRSEGIRISSIMPAITSAPVSTPPALITPPPLPAKVVETSEVQPPTVRRVRQTPEGLVVENRPVQALPVVNRSENVVFRAPNVSGNQLGKSDPVRQTELQPLKSHATSGILPPLAKPAVAPQDKDCGCDK